MKPEILLGLVGLILSPFGGEANILDQKNALLQGAVRIPYSPPQKLGTLRTISWKFEKNGERSVVLDITEKRYHEYSSQFKNRLQVSDDFLTLTIRGLTREDSGIYIIDVVDVNGDTDLYSSHVTVYEPIPVPIISTDMKEKTTGRCNFTLNCSAPSSISDVSYTWKCRRRRSEYQPYHTGSTIQISLLPDHQDMELLCIVQNPADQKNVSFRVQDNCVFSEQSAARSHFPVLIVILITTLLLVVTLSLYSWRRYKRRKEPIQNRNAELNYIEVTTHRPDSNPTVQMENDHYIGMTAPKRTKVETLYSMLQHPPPTHT